MSWILRHDMRIVSSVQFLVTRSIVLQCEHLGKVIVFFVATYFWYFCHCTNSPLSLHNRKLSLHILCIIVQYFMPFILWRQYSVTTGRQCNGLGAVYTPWVLLWPHNAMRKSDLCRRACERVRLSVRLSDCLSRSCILSKRVIVFSNFSRLDHHYFSIQKLMAIFWREPPNGGIECRWSMKTRSFALAERPRDVSCLTG